jgi:hypothetical protein
MMMMLHGACHRQTHDMDDDMKFVFSLSHPPDHEDGRTIANNNHDKSFRRRQAEEVITDVVVRRGRMTMATTVVDDDYLMLLQSLSMTMAILIERA